MKWKHMFAVLTLAVGSITFLPAATCTPQEAETAKTVAKEALTLTQTLCIIAHAWDTTVESICNVEKALVPAMESLLGSTRKQAVSFARNQLAMQHCPVPLGLTRDNPYYLPDAGPDAGP